MDGWRVWILFTKQDSYLGLLGHITVPLLGWYAIPWRFSAIFLIRRRTCSVRLANIFPDRSVDNFVYSLSGVGIAGGSRGISRFVPMDVPPGVLLPAILPPIVAASMIVGRDHGTSCPCPCPCPCARQRGRPTSQTLMRDCLKTHH